MVVPQAAINNIMGGIESTGGVRLHNHRRKLKQRFDIVRKLGQGNYGKVQLGINKETGQEVAIKTIKKCKIETEADLIRIRREIQIMSSVRHPNIIHIYEVFENREKMVLVMEYAAGGELYDFLDQKKVLTEEEARRIFRQIATAIYYCHKHKICHRDLKLENILLDENGNAKIADFGLSNVFTESRFLSTFCGSPLYASPEIVKGIPYHGPEVDCWSLGVLLYTLVYGAMPFDGSNFKRLVKQISNGDYFEPKNQSTASPLIAEMLNINPSSRADITVICSHWWIDKDQTVACMYESEELANQTPVRLDLLLSLAPSPSTDKIVVGTDVPNPGDGNRPLRSQSLGNIPPIMEMPNEYHTPPSTVSEKQETQPSDNAVSVGVKRKDISTSSVHKTKGEKTEEAQQAKSKTGNTLEEPQALVQEPTTPLAEHPCSESGAEEIYPDETALETLTPNTPDPLVCEPITPLPAGFVSDDNSSKDTTTSEDKTGPNLAVPNQVPYKSVPNEEVPNEAAEPSPLESKPAEAKPYKERRRSSVLETVEKFNKQPTAPPKKILIPGTKVTGGAPAKKVYERKSSTGTAIPLANSTSRKSLAEISPNIPLPANTTVPRTTESPNRKVETSPSNANTFCLASTVNVNLLAEQALSSPEMDTDVVQPPPYISNKGEQEKHKKVQNAVSVIGKALGGSSDNLDKKSSTLPRRKSKADFVQPTPFIVPMPSKPPGEFRSEIRHMVNTPPPSITQRTEVSFPVAAAHSPPPHPTSSPASKSVTRQGNQSREHIIPIKFEQDTVSPQPPPPAATPIRKSSSQQSQQNISRTSSRSLSRQSTGDSDSSICSSGDPIRKSAREVIIPIAVEGGGYITPSSTALDRINSITESEDDASASGSAAPRCFTLRSTRRRVPSHTNSPGTSKSVLETADSVSSDEDDDNFEILTAENLFSTLLSRVRSLTQRLNTDEHRSAFPRSLFHHGSIFDNPGSRLSETRSFSRADGIHPWRRSLSREPISGGSSSTLPRDRSKSSHRNTLNSSPQSSREDKSPYRSRLRPPITIKNSLSKQLMKERLDELDGIDKANETKVKSRHNGANSNNAEYMAANNSKNNYSEPYVYKMRTRQRTNTIEPDGVNTKSGIYHMRTRNRSNSSEVVNETPELSSLRTKRPISIHESLDSNSPVARRIYQRSFSCDRNKVNAILKDSAKILQTNNDEAIPSPVQSFKRTNSLRQPASFDRKKEYRRSFSTNTTSGYGETSVLDRYLPNSNSSAIYSLERVLSPTRNVSRFLRSIMYEPSEITNISSSLGDTSVGLESSSRIKNTIRSLKESSVGPESSIDSESNLIKRAIAMESKNSGEPRSSVYRTHSLKQNSTSSKNVYKDLISKIVNSREGNVSRSIFNEKNNNNLVKNDSYGGNKKPESETSSKEEASRQNDVYEQEHKETENFQNNETVTNSDRQIPRISRFLRSNNNNTNNNSEKTAETMAGSKLPTRLTPNSEPILLRNRRYSIPRLNAGSRDVSNKRATDSEKNPNKLIDKNVSTPQKVQQSNGHLGEKEVGDLQEGLLKDQSSQTSDTKDEDNSLEKVEKVINNLQNAQNKNRTESISKLQRLDLSKIHPRDSGRYDRSSMSRSLDHCDNSSRCSFRSPTEDSDGWSVCSDVTDIRGDCPSPSSPSSAHEETVSERIRRKSFFSRFNPMRNSGGEQVILPSRLQSYARSSSADNPNTSQHGLLRPRKSYLKTRDIK